MQFLRKHLSLISAILLLSGAAVAADTIGFDGNYGIVTGSSGPTGTATGEVDMSTFQFKMADGTAAEPGIVMRSDDDGTGSGFYRVGADNLGISMNGVLRWDISTTAVTNTLPTLAAAGTVGAPSWAFSADADGTGTGFYRSGANTLAVATNGVLRMTFGSTGDVTTAGTHMATEFQATSAAATAHWLTSNSFAQTVLSSSSSAGRQFVFTDSANRSLDHNHATTTNPTIFVHSATSPASNDTQWMSFTHDQTNGIIDVGLGNITLSDPVKFSSAVSYTVATATTAAFTMLGSHYQILCDSTSNAVEVDLQAAATAGVGRVIHIKNIDNTNGCTVDPSGSETIDNSATTVTLTALQNLTLISDGSEWWIQ